MKGLLKMLCGLTLALGLIWADTDNPPPDIIWNRVYDSGTTDYALGVAVDDNYLYVTGYSYNGTNDDSQTICYDKDGYIQMSKPKMSFLPVVFVQTNITEVHRDSNFKSIHQLQSEEHQRDTVDTASNVKPEINQGLQNPSKSFKQKQPLMVMIILALIIAVSVFLVARKLYRTKKG